MPTPIIDAAETLYRQIGPGGDPIYYDPARNPTVHPSRFLPTAKDIDGLSLIRSRFREVIWSAYRPEQPTVRFRLASMKAAKLRELAMEIGLSSLNFNSTADSLDERFGEPWAHCVVMEINRTDYDDNLEVKKRIKEWAMKVAGMVTNQDVIGPFREPTNADPYRPNTA